MTTIRVHFYDTKETTDILIYETDTDESILLRLKCTGCFFPSYVYFPKTFHLEKFQEKPQDFKLLDLGRVFFKSTNSYEKEFKKMIRLYPALKTHYDITLVDFLQKWVFHWVYTNTDTKAPHLDEYNLIFVKQSITKSVLGEFSDPLINTETNLKINRNEFLVSLDQSWYSTFLQTQKDDLVFQRDKNADALEKGKQFSGLKGISSTPIEELGKIVLFDVKTKDMTTGMLFDRLTLTPLICIARYKNFYKIRTGVSFEPDAFQDRVPDFYSLSIYSVDGNIIAYVTNSPGGLKCQCIFSEQSGLQTYNDFFTLFGLDPQLYKPREENSVGILAEFFLDNPAPRGTKDFEWSALQAPLFADLCFNNETFSRFLSVNDTDKISRNNHSLYVYFSSPVKEVANDNVVVGGWNRLSSRFGDLTAILTPVHYKSGDTKIHVKITRSVSLKIVNSFHYIFTRLVALYNQLYKEQLDMFQKLVDYAPIFVPPTVTTYGSLTLTEVEPVLFPKNVYNRKCQKGKVPVIVSDEKAATIKDERLKLKFPPVEINDIVPRWYICHNKPGKDGNVYRYPGFAPLTDVQKHPFGFAPCCFSEDHLEKNKEKIQTILKTNKPGPTVIDLKSKPLYRLKSDKIIRTTGQLGVVPQPVERLLENIVPLAQFSRVGMANEWSNASILACCEYWYGVKNKKSEFRSQRVLRKLLLESNIAVALQENCDIGIQGIIDILQKDEYIDPLRFYRLLEHFYGIQLFILTRDRSQKFGCARPHFLKSYAWSVEPGSPLLIIYQHYGGETNAMYTEGPPRCELIGYEVHNKPADAQLELSFEMNDTTLTLFELLYSCFRGDEFNTPVIFQKSSPLEILIHQQFIDVFGKIRVFYLTEGLYPAVLVRPIAPMSVPNRTSPSVDILPSAENVMALITALGLTIKQKQSFEEYIFIEVDTYLCPLIFIARRPVDDDDETFHPLTQEPPCLHYIIPKKKCVVDIFLWNQRFVDILKDYLLLRLSVFMADEKRRLETLSFREISDAFLKTRVSFDKKFNQPPEDEVSPLVSENQHLFDDNDRLILPWNFQRKIRYFLEWSLNVKYDEIASLRDRRELPSYYQSIYNFRHVRNHIIQVTLTSIQSTNDYAWIGTPLRDIAPFDTIQYYYNPAETPRDVPYIFLYSPDGDALKRRASVYIATGNLIAPIDEESVEPTDTYFFQRHDTQTWERRGPVDDAQPRVALFEGLQGFFGLFPFRHDF